MCITMWAITLFLTLLFVARGKNVNDGDNSMKLWVFSIIELFTQFFSLRQINVDNWPYLVNKMSWSRYNRAILNKNWYDLSDIFLGDGMNQELRDAIKKRLVEKLVEVYKWQNGKPTLKISLKKDNSVVTEIDLFLSELIKNELPVGLNFLSEEEDNSYLSGELPFPLAILDPIDGTIELSRGIGECSLSLAILDAEKQWNSFAWIYNPFTGFELTSDDNFTKPLSTFDGPIYGLTSRTEWNDGLFSNHDSSQIVLHPRGSIAFKLGLLAAGAADFVITLRPKNIWDIAAGSVLCWKRGFKMFVGMELITELNQLRYQGPIIWCKDENQLAAIRFSVGIR